MTDCDCTCCEHATVEPVSDESPTDDVPFVKWTDQDGNTYITVPHG